MMEMDAPLLDLGYRQSKTYMLAHIVNGRYSGWVGRSSLSTVYHPNAHVLMTCNPGLHDRVRALSNISRGTPIVNQR